MDSEGSIYVGDRKNHLIRKIDHNGYVSTLAGKAGVSGSTNGQGTSATFNWPSGVAVDKNGVVYVADVRNHLVRKIDRSGIVTTLAGQAGIQGSEDGYGTSATFNSPQDLVADHYGNIYVVGYNNIIRKIDQTGHVTTLAGEV